MPGSLAGWPDELPGQLSLDPATPERATEEAGSSPAASSDASSSEQVAWQDTQPRSEMVSHRVPDDPFAGL